MNTHEPLFESTLLRIIAASSSEFFAIVNIETFKTLWVNRHALEMFEYKSEEEFKEHNFHSLRKNKPTAKHLQFIKNAINEKGVWEEDTEFVTKTGRVFHGHLVKRSFTYADKELLLVQIDDEEKVKEATEGMEREKLRFEAFVKQAVEGIIIVNQKGKMILVNPATEKLFGYQSNELIGNKIEMLMPEQYRRQHISSRKNFLKNPHTISAETRSGLRAVKKDGTEFPIEILLSSYKENGERFGFAFVTDASQKKQREETIVKLNNELEHRIKEKTHSLENVIEQLQHQVRIAQDAKEESANALLFQKTILDNAGAIIVVTDTKGLITHFNPVAEEKLGYKAVELVNKYTPALFHDAEEVKKRAKELSAELGEEVKPGFELFVVKTRYGLPNEHEWIQIKKDGTRFPIRLSVTAIRNSENKITGYIGVALDISDEKKLEEELFKNLNKEQELNRLKSSFVSMASHEFRTPLTGILSSANLLAKYTSTEQQEKRDRHINQIKTSANNLISILNEFLSLGKMEEGKIEAKYETFDLEEFTGKLCGEIKNIAKPGQAITYKHEGKNKIKLDPDFVRHILSNLTTNAIKYSDENSRIQISTKVKNGDILLSVKDNGIGISKEDQKHIFERFFRASNVGGTQGTGLGLHIAKRYVEMLDGSIKMKSQLGKGTEFVIQLPNKK